MAPWCRSSSSWSCFAGAIGLYDDLRGLGGVVKPALLALVSGSSWLLAEHFYPSVYNPRLLPALHQDGDALHHLRSDSGRVHPVSSNAFNMLDAFNGEISGFTTIVSLRWSSPSS